MFRSIMVRFRKYNLSRGDPDMRSDLVERVWRQRRYRLLLGVAVGALLGVAFAAGNRALYEWIAVLSPRPEHDQETGTC